MSGYEVTLVFKDSMLVMSAANCLMHPDCVSTKNLGIKMMLIIQKQDALATLKFVQASTSLDKYTNSLGWAFSVSIYNSWCICVKCVDMLNLGG